MTGEEMEITTDFGPHDPGEEIDIDLDFAVGNADEDLELADFDQEHDHEHFNSDNRDELMAERDDASFGMVDAGDILNPVAAVSNDIDIDINGVDEGAWQQEEMNTHQGEGDILDDIDFVDHGSTEATNALTQDAFDGITFSNDVAADSIPSLPEVLPSGDDLKLQPSNEHSETQQGLEATTAIDYQDFAAYGDTEEPSTLDNQNDLGFDELKDEQVESFVPKVSEPELPEQTTAEVTDAVQSNNITTSTGQQLQDNEEEEIAEQPQEQTQPSFEEQEDKDDEEDYEHQLNHEDGTQDHDEIQTTNTGTQESGSKDSLLQNPSLENGTEGLTEANEADEEAEALTISMPGEEGQAQYDELGDDEFETATAVAEPSTEPSADIDTSKAQSAVVASRHAMFINYGRQDYRLFAKTEDDDPNDYFLHSDMSALGVSLYAFLSSIRDVISDEVSPLDELVMCVDGLGLEFCETTSSDFLQNNTLGDIVALYDKLVENDNTENRPDFYIYLTIRPNCSQRLSALLESAEAGRGLSEIAIYRDSSPQEDANPNNTKELAISLDGEDDDVYDEAYNELSGEAEVEGEADAPEDDVGDQHDATELIAAEPVAQTSTNDKAEGQEVGQEAEAFQNGDYPNQDAPDEEDDLIDYSDDELDLSASNDQAPDIPETEDAIARIDATDDEPAEVADAAAVEDSLATGPILQEGGPVSDTTSGTATLQNDQPDEIDYSDEDDIDTGANDNVSRSTKAQKNSAQALQVPVDDEITWESENEEARNESTKAAPAATVQVSPTTGKRARDDLDGLEGGGEENGVKRHRS